MRYVERGRTTISWLPFSLVFKIFKLLICQTAAWNCLLDLQFLETKTRLTWALVCDGDSAPALPFLWVVSSKQLAAVGLELLDVSASAWSTWAPWGLCFAPGPGETMNLRESGGSIATGFRFQVSDWRFETERNQGLWLGSSHRSQSGALGFVTRPLKMTWNHVEYSEVIYS